MTFSERPTAATIRRVDLSAPESGASAARTTEADLYAAYGASTLETRPCVCGGGVTADPQRPGPGVAAHQFTSRHKAWRSTQELD